jgi:predicted acyl esterase
LRGRDKGPKRRQKCKRQFAETKRARIPASRDYSYCQQVGAIAEASAARLRPRSKPWRPWHALTRAATKKVTPGEITEYAVEILATANPFCRGYRICLEIASADMPTGVAGATNIEYIPNHCTRPIMT